MAFEAGYRVTLVVGTLSLLCRTSLAAADCGIPVSPINGGVEFTSLTSGSIASYICSYGYNLVGATSVLCFDGLWSEPAPSCLPIDCGPLTLDPNSDVECSSGTLFGSACTASCSIGYDMTGTSILQCLASGLWDLPPPTCTLVDCGPVVPNMNSFVDCSGGTTYGSLCSAGCDPGYVMSGGSYMQCLSSGLWDLPPPTCTIADCYELVPPQDGAVIYLGGTTYGNTAEYTCNAGFSLSGFKTRTCQASGVWSDTPPYCLPDVCQAPIAPVRGSVSCGSLLQGGICTFNCNTGYAVDGAPVLTCLQSGLFDFAAPTCLFTGATGCSQLWTSPSIFPMHSVTSSQLNYTMITSYPAVSELACARMCRHQAEISCGVTDGCKLIMYNSILETCAMYKEDDVGGSTIDCPGTNKCFAHFIIA